ncbi:unnamed protein product [Oncorhynchus mykiss]|uniref:Junctional cadherin 5 associated a n=1 Tax=Oncorhynchus mykiss TaxID=8022 RepID=A0A060WT68_ONCMY|nr:unnamed protein product [Oncorhynchus mykiss]
MYSVEDLLISHGYKLPKTSIPCPSSTSSATAPYEKQRHAAADCHREIPAAENQRSGRGGSLNGNEQAGDRGACVFSSSRQALLAKGYPGSCDNESGGERNQRRKEAVSGNLGDSLAQPLGDSLATDSGPVYYPRGGELQRQDYFAQHSAIFGMEPPGYIPPPSYKRALPPIRGGPINRNEVANYKWRGEVKIQMHMPMSSEAGKWFSGQTGGSWLEHYGDRGIPYRKQVNANPNLNPGYTEEHLGHVHYLPFDDPRVRQISGGPGGNSLTATDKFIRNMKKETPCAKVLGQSTHDSAFPPPQGLSLNNDCRKTSLNDNNGGSSTRWCNRGLINKGSVDSVAPDQSCGIYPTAFHIRPPQQLIRHLDQGQGVSETVTQVKTKTDSEKPEKNEKKSVKQKLSETIFCLVSVHVPLTPGGTSRDQNNNNDEKPPSPVRPPSPVDSRSENKTGHLTNQSFQSTSSAEAELQALTGSIASSRSSSKIVRKIPTKPPKINHHKELKLSGAWPGNQYRDQETQTSPEARKPQHPPPPGTENKEAQDPHVPAPGSSDIITQDPSGVGNTAFSCPIKGVKSLKPSSNSAFSRTATFSISSQLIKSTAQPPAAPPPPPPPPSGNAMEAKPAATCSGQEAFGQFLLKPVSRRPWDAIEELETINKEFQDQQQQKQQQSSKRPSVDQCIEDLNEAYKDILELGTASNNISNNSGAVQIPERIKIRLAGEAGLSKPSSLRRSIESWSVSVDPEYGEVKSAFSRPAERKSVTFSKQLREELPVPPRKPTGFREYRVVSNLSQRRRSCSGRTVKLDLPSPSETPPPYFSPMTPTTHTAAEVPWADRQPMQDASTLTSPPDYEDICQSLQKPRDSEVNKTFTAISKPGGGSCDTEPIGGACLDSAEECPICKRERESQMSRPSPMSPLHEESSPDLSDQSSATIVGDRDSPQGAETSEEPAEGDTKVSSDSGSNHSEAQTIWEQRVSETATESKPAASEDTESSRANEQTVQTHVRDPDSEELDSGTVSTVPPDRQEAKEKETPQDNPEYIRSAKWTHLGRETPGMQEFPPDRLPLSVPINPDLKLSHSLEGEMRGRGPLQRVDALQDKLAASPSHRVAVERRERMKEVDPVSRMRCLSIRSTDSGEEGAEKEGETKRGGGQVEVLSLPASSQSDTVEDREVSEDTVLQDEEVSSLSGSYFIHLMFCSSIFSVELCYMLF